MNRLARYHLVASIIMGLVTLTVAAIAVRQWFKEGRPPVYTMWPEQALVVCGFYRFVYHARAFNAARVKK